MIYKPYLLMKQTNRSKNE